MNKKTAYFVPSLVSFIPSEWKDDGTYADERWPDDAILLTEEQTEEYWMSSPPEGKMLGVVDGLPGWIDIPPPSDDQVIALNKSMSEKYNAQATRRIDILTDATDPEIMGDDILPEDIDLLKKWRAYRVKLSRITDFLNPSWPEMPE